MLLAFFLFFFFALLASGGAFWVVRMQDGGLRPALAAAFGVLLAVVALGFGVLHLLREVTA